MGWKEAWEQKVIYDKAFPSNSHPQFGPQTREVGLCFVFFLRFDRFLEVLSAEDIEEEVW